MSLLTMVRSLRNDRLECIPDSEVPTLTSRRSFSAPSSPRADSPSESGALERRVADAPMLLSRADAPTLLSRRSSSKLDNLVAGVPTLISRKSSNLLASFRSLRRRTSRTSAVSEPSSPRPQSPCGDSPEERLFSDEHHTAAVVIQTRARRRRSGFSAHVLSLWPSLAALRGVYLDAGAIAAGARNSILYTDAMVVAREALRTHPQIVAALDVAWAAVSQGATELRQDAYFSMARRLYLVLQLMGETKDGTFSVQDCLESTRADWDDDRCGKDHLTKADFFRCWFQLADLHTEAVSASAYAWWIGCVVERIARPRQGAMSAGRGGWEWRDDRAIMAEASTLPRAHRLSAARQKLNGVPRVRKLGVWERLLWNSTFLPAQRAEKKRQESAALASLTPLPPPRRSSAGQAAAKEPRAASRSGVGVMPAFCSGKRLLNTAEPTPPQPKAAKRSPPSARRSLPPLGRMAPVGPSEHAQRAALPELPHTPRRPNAHSAIEELRSRRLAPLAAGLHQTGRAMVV